MAARLAGFGYAVLLPDVYYRTATGSRSTWRPCSATPSERTRLMSMVGSVTPDMIAADAGAFFDFLASRPEVKGDAFGVCGYCMGGRTSVIVAGRRARPRGGRGIVPRRRPGHRRRRAARTCWPTR